MKQTLIISSIGLASLLAGGCTDKFDVLQNIQTPAGAQVRFIHAAPDAPAIDIYVNEQRISGAAVATTNPTGSLLYSSSSVFPSLDYSSIPAGNTKVKVVTAAGGTVASPLLTADLMAESGKRYSFFATGTAPAYSLVAIPDELPTLAGNSFFVRVVNLVPNSTNVTLTYDGKDVITTIAPGKASDFIAIAPPADYKTGLIRTANFQAKVNGTIPVATTALGSLSIQPGGVLTFCVRGVMTTDPKVPTKYAVSLLGYTNR